MKIQRIYITESYVEIFTKNLFIKEALCVFLCLILKRRRFIEQDSFEIKNVSGDISMKPLVTCNWVGIVDKDLQECILMRY